MNTARFQRFLPVAGMLFSLLLLVAIALTASEPGTSDSVAKVFSYWAHHRTEQVVSLVALHLATVLLVFFGAGLRAALRSGEPGEASYSSVAFGGCLLAAAGFGIVAMNSAAATSAAHVGSQSAVYTISQLSSTDWLAWTPGLTVMLVAAGLGGLRTLALPRALSWVAIVLGVAFFTPAGYFALMLLVPWTLATSVVLYRNHPAEHYEPTPVGSPVAQAQG